MAICKAALPWLLFLCQCHDVSTEVRRLAASVLSNLAVQPLNRSRLYRAELAMKRRGVAHQGAARNLFYRARRFSGTTMHDEEEGEEEEEEELLDESSELGELGTLAESEEGLHSDTEAGERSKRSTMVLPHAEEAASGRSSRRETEVGEPGRRRSSTVHAETGGSSSSRRVADAEVEAEVEAAELGLGVSTSAGRPSAVGAKRGLMKLRFLQFSDAVEAEDAGQQQHQWLTVGGLPADLASAWVQQRQSLQVGGWR